MNNRPLTFLLAAALAFVLAPRPGVQSSSTTSQTPTQIVIEETKKTPMLGAKD